MRKSPIIISTAIGLIVGVIIAFVLSSLNEESLLKVFVLFGIIFGFLLSFIWNPLDHGIFIGDGCSLVLFRFFGLSVFFAVLGAIFWLIYRAVPSFISFLLVVILFTVIGLGIGGVIEEKLEKK